MNIYIQYLSYLKTFFQWIHKGVQTGNRSIDYRWINRHASIASGVERFFPRMGTQTAVVIIPTDMGQHFYI